MSSVDKFYISIHYYSKKETVCRAFDQKNVTIGMKCFHAIGRLEKSEKSGHVRQKMLCFCISFFEKNMYNKKCLESMRESKN